MQAHLPSFVVHFEKGILIGLFGRPLRIDRLGFGQILDLEPGSHIENHPGGLDVNAHGGLSRWESIEKGEGEPFDNGCNLSSEGKSESDVYITNTLKFIIK